ncbi:MAG: serine hydrolase [Bacillota bacterium]|nr:serine hydrolase [Bacillota bacterium]
MPADTASAIHELMHHYHMYGWFNGAVLVGEKGEVVYSNGFGWADLEWRIPNTTDTKFCLGSITKQFTSMLIIQLAEEGRLALDGKVSTYLPYYREDTGSRLTLHNLLTHTSGLPNYTAQPGFAGKVARNPVKVEEFVKDHCSGDLEFEPGSEFSYSNSGYFVLGAVIEAVTGKDYEAVLRSRILDPLGMKDTGYDRSEPILPKRAKGYEQDLEGYRNCGFIDMTIPYAAGSMYSTVEDLHKWDRALRTEILIPRSNRQRMLTPVHSNYAYGWLAFRLRPENLARCVDPLGVEPDPDGMLIVTHGGGINGFGAAIFRAVSEQRVVILLNNTGGTILTQMAANVLKVLYEQPYDLPKQPAAPLLYRTVKTDGADRAMLTYRGWRESETGRYDTGELELLRLARQCMRADRPGDAETVLRTAAECFPASDTVMLDLAGCLLAQGHKDQAVETLERVLQRSPKLPGFVRRAILAQIAAARAAAPTSS